MLSELKAKDIKLAVVSNKPDSAVQKLSREYFGDRMDFASARATACAASRTPTWRRRR